MTDAGAKKNDTWPMVNTHLYKAMWQLMPLEELPSANTSTLFDATYTCCVIATDTLFVNYENFYNFCMFHIVFSFWQDVCSFLCLSLQN